MIEDNKKPLRGRPKTLNKEDVLEVAMRAYWEEGPTEVSLNSVCKRAGVSKPSLYREFGNEDGLARAVLENYVQKVVVKVIEAITGDGSFADRLDRLTYLVAQSEQHASGCLYVKMRAVKSNLGDKTQLLITQTEELALDAYARFLTEGRENGEWSGAIDVPLGAQYFHAQIGLAMAQRASGDDPKAVLGLAFSVFR